LPNHSELCRFVSGSQTKHQVSSHAIVLLKIFVCIGNRYNILKDVIQSSLCSGVKECETKRAHNFVFSKSSFRIPRATVLGMFKDCAIILDTIRWSLLNKSATAAIFTSVRVDLDGRLSYLLPAPFRLDREYHLKTLDLFTAIFHKHFAPILVFLSQIDRL
jgi:hypothetical protein